MTITARGREAVAFQHTDRIPLSPERSDSISFDWKPPRFDSEVYTVTTDLIGAEDKVIDTITHEMGVLSMERAPASEFVTVKGSDFFLRGKPWYPVGVNFWTLYVSGLEPDDYWRGWLYPGFYDPEEVERDLERMTALGMNMVSIQLGDQGNLRNLLDFLRRCRAHDVKVFGFLGPASPLGFDHAKVAQFISAGRLAENPALFAYDTIWEPGNWVFRKDKRRTWDRDWGQWIAERYGSIANAEADWGISVPRTDGKTTSPSDRQFRQDGPWRVMMAAYRRFMDDLASRKWNDAHRRLRQLDPRHLVSFRQGNTLPQDFTFTATPKHIDFICPEGYAIRQSEDGYNAAGFITRYVHFTTRGKPIIWSEFGQSVWDRAAMRSDPKAMPRQAEYHDLFYRMVLEAGANGTAPWWWPGGYRTNERSDYGICNPDGTPRPSALLIKKYSPAMKTPRPHPNPDTWLTIDRDAHPGGYWYIAFNHGKDAYRDAVAKDRNLGIRTEATGTTSVNVPLVAVGNTRYTGNNPPKYLNAEFNWLRVRDAAGRWVEAADGAKIEVAKGAPVLANVCVGNTQEAQWLAPSSAQGKLGAVYLVSTKTSELNVKRPIPRDTQYLTDADFGQFALSPGVATRTKVEVCMAAEGRATFGEKRTFWLAPKQ